jgi:CPA2 family monovalent cation:H+ antiporter-2
VDNHTPVLIATIAIGLTLAFILGMVCRRLGLPAIIGYLLAGVLVGPHTVGYVADEHIATELAEIGVILLMFGVGIHFSIRDLLAVGPVAIPGAIVQSLVATIVGTGVGVLMGWGIVGGVVLGLSISVASTVVLLRALIERGELDSIQGRVAIGWLIAEDLLTVLILVLLPSVAPLLTGVDDGSTSAFGPLGDLVSAIAATALFAAIMLVAGARLVPRILDLVALEHSRELFTLAVVALAVGVAYAGYQVFGVSLALGGFLAGAVVNRSDLSHQASADALPLQDAFSVLFFVSVGMLVDPGWIIAHPLPVVAVTLVVMVVKSLAAFGIVAALGYPARVGVTVAAALSQIGEFSFILITVGVGLGLVPRDALQPVVAAALVSIALNPVMFRFVDPVVERLDQLPLLRRLSQRPTRTLAVTELPHPEMELRGHAVVCGHGRVGRLVTAALDRRSFPYVVITNDRHEAQRLRDRGTPVLSGDAAIPALLEHARIREARVLVVAMRDGYAARLVVDRARELAPRVSVVVRTHSEQERDVFQGMRDTQTVFGELEVAVQMTRYALTRFGVSMREADAITQGLRGRGGGSEGRGPGRGLPPRPRYLPEGGNTRGT